MLVIYCPEILLKTLFFCENYFCSLVHVMVFGLCFSQIDEI